MMILSRHSLTYYLALFLFASAVVEASSSSDSEIAVNASSSESGPVTLEGGASANANANAHASSYDIDLGNSTDGTSIESLDDSGNPISSEDSTSEDSNASVDSSDHTSDDDSSSTSTSMISEDIPGSSTDGTSIEESFDDSGNPISSEDSTSEDSDESVDSSDDASDDDSSSSSTSMNSEDGPNEDGVQNKKGDEVDLTVDGKETIFSILYNKLDGQEVCDANMGEWIKSMARFAVEKDDTSITELLEDASAQQEGLCSESDSIDFAIALEEFTSCSGFDLGKVIENLPDIKLGTLARCANFFSVLDGSWSYLRHEECTQIVLGDDPLGEAIRSFYLHPDKNCPCLQYFSRYVPDCVLDARPLRLVGGWMKKATCFLSSLSCGDFLETACFHELEGLDDCLPMEEDEASCDETLDCRFKQNSVSLSVPKSMLGIPLPDACGRIFKERRKSALGLVDTNIPDRYAKFQKQCTSGEEIWESNDKSPAVATINEMDDENEPAKDPFESSSQGSYLALAAMMLVAGGGVGALVVYRRQQIEDDWRRPEGYQVIELT